jgi:hypothetical protein
MGNLLCCVQVPQSQVAMKEGFGKFEKVLQPGCHCMPWFLGKRVAGHLTLRLQQLDIKCETKTKVCYCLKLQLNQIFMSFHALLTNHINTFFLARILIPICLWLSLSLVSGHFQYFICMHIFLIFSPMN